MRKSEKAAKRGALTTVPIYGATRAPLRWITQIIEDFRKAGRNRRSVDPCLYRFGEGGTLAGMAAIHFEDILSGRRPNRWEIANAVIGIPDHIGLAKLSIDSDVIYMGLDIVRKKGYVGASQSPFIRDRLFRADLGILENPTAPLYPTIACCHWGAL